MNIVKASDAVQFNQSLRHLLPKCTIITICLFTAVRLAGTTWASLFRIKAKNLYEFIEIGSFFGVRTVPKAQAKSKKAPTIRKTLKNRYERIFEH
jgi:hypothetical protein